MAPAGNLVETFSCEGDREVGSKEGGPRNSRRFLLHAEWEIVKRTAVAGGRSGRERLLLEIAVINPQCP